MEAIEELRRIARRIEEQKPVQARDLIDAVEACCLMAIEMEKLQADIEELKQSSREPMGFDMELNQCCPPEVGTDDDRRKNRGW